MTDLLKKAFSEAEKLPAAAQDALAEVLLADLTAERRWDSALQTGHPKLSDLAAEARTAHRTGQTRPIDPDTM